VTDAPIFCTGITGFIGKRLLPLLLAEGRRIHVVVRDPSRLKMPEGAPLRIFSGDIGDPGVVRRAMEGCGEGYHLAAQVQILSGAAEYERSNVAGTRNVLVAARELGLRRLVYSSSIVVYANDPAPMKDESARITGDFFNSDYHRTKYYAHLEASRFAAEGLPVILVMPASVFGPTDVSDANRVLAWCRRFRQRRVLHWLPDGGRLVLNLVYGEDVARGILLAMRRGTPGEGYILGGDNVSIRNLMEGIGRLAGDPRPFRSFPSAPLTPLASLSEAVARLTRTRPILRRGLVRSLQTSWAFSSEKAKRDLGYSWTPFDEALRLTFESA
jgi:nucleoside-diphosphate-sugar epimerase